MANPNPPTHPYGPRWWLTLAGLGLIALLGVAIPLKSIVPFIRENDPELAMLRERSVITPMEARLAAARPHLEGVTSVGILWISDRGPTQPDPRLQERIGGIAQYALAPTLVTQAPQGELYLGMLARPGYLPAWVLGSGLRLEADLGNGLVLLRPPDRTGEGEGWP